MPQTLQDAIKITRLLGVRYIWIDALCIIQDSREDWKRESQVMNLVYGNAYLVVAALTSSNAFDGFLHRRPGFEVTFRLPVLTEPTTDTASLDSWLPPTTINAYFRATDLSGLGMEEDMHSGEWITRGWTHQERYLARRIVYFTERQLYFSCGADYRSENNEPAPWEGLPLRFSRARFLLDSSTSRSLTTLPRIYTSWYQIVMDYTSCNLTYNSDKLPAITGLSNELLAANKVRNERFLAGLWQSDLAYGMLWIVVRSWMIKSVLDKGNEAPSWSWASTVGRVTWNRTAEDSPERQAWRMFQLIDVVVEEVNMIEKWRMVVNGKVAMAKLVLRKEVVEELKKNDRETFATDPTFWYGFFHDVVDAGSGTIIGKGILDQDSIDLSGELADEVNRREIWCFPVMTHAMGDIRWKWSGLLLEKVYDVHESGETIFRRIGAYCLLDECADHFSSIESEKMTLV